MATDMKRFTISVTDDMEERLDRLKQAKYYKVTRNRMIQDLICIGLDTMQDEIATVGKIRDSTAVEARAEPTAEET